MKRTPRRTLTVTVLTASTLALAGCTWPWSSSHSDAPDPGGRPGTNAAVIQFPDGFRNVAFECFGTQGVYVTSHGVATNPTSLPSSVFVVPGDPHCRG